MSILALYLDSPLQSWGYQSRFDRRTTLSYPTRSGVIGILAAALGIERGDRDGLARLQPLGLTIYAYPGHIRLCDYHTIGGGYDKATHRQHIPRSADGSVGSTMQTYRDYLQDARFGVLLTGDDDLLQELDAALRDPRYGIWLGRKACIPASPVSQGLHSSEAAALQRLGELAGCDPVRQISEVTDFGEGTDTVMDAPLDFRERAFAPRRISDGAYLPPG